MAFIGIISDSKKYDLIKRFINTENNKNQFTLININSRSIANIKNVKFDVIVILNLPKNKDEYIEYLEQICSEVKILVINSDVEINGFLQEVKTNIITFGVNHLSTVTFSSATDDSVLISVQRNYKGLKGNIVEVGEYDIQIEKINRNYLHEILIFFILKTINNL